MKTYTHYAKQADVFKHLVLCEVLGNEMPIAYVDTNSACAVYHLGHTPEQDYGIYHFLRKASIDDKLKNSLYYRLESDALNKGAYYGSPALAMKIVKENADKYYFFDLDCDSLDNVKEFAEQESLGNRIIVRNCDSTRDVMDLLPDFPKDTFIHIDPYEIDKKGIDGHTYFDVFTQATRLGMKCLLWYGFMTLDDKLRLDKYMASHLRKSDIRDIVGAKLIMNNIGKDTVLCNPGILGSGLLASNLSIKSNRLLLDFSRLLVEAYKDSRYEDYDGSLYNELM